MLLTHQQAEHLSEHLELDGEDTYMFVDNGNVSDSYREELFDWDAEYFEVYGYHMITNYQDLKKTSNQPQTKVA